MTDIKITERTLYMSSLWQDEISLPRFQSLEGDISTDVLIIGGGMAGIMVALELRRRGISYILVEKDRICGGTTHNTTAKITAQHGLVYHRIANRYGLGAAKAYLEANLKAIDRYTELCRDIDCDFEQKDNYVYTLDSLDVLNSEMAVLKRIGYPAELRCGLPLPLDTVGAVRFPAQAQFNPLKFVAAVAKDLNIYEHTFVKNVSNGVAVTHHGKIRAKKTVVATHFPFMDRFGGYFLKMYQHRSYVIALRGAYIPDGMYVDDSGTGLSFRSYGELLLLGGGGHRTGKNGGGWEYLRKTAEKAYKGSEETHHWATQDCMTLDEIPYIGRYCSLTPDLYVATGFNKWGMTSSAVAAEVLADALTDKKNKYEQLFAPQRNIFTRQLWANIGESALNLVRPTAPRCTHLGCALTWNSTEHTWDCPCHGSRYSEDGKVIDNPSTKNLKR